MSTKTNLQLTPATEPMSVEGIKVVIAAELAKLPAQSQLQHMSDIQDRIAEGKLEYEALHWQLMLIQLERIARLEVVLEVASV